MMNKQIVYIKLLSLLICASCISQTNIERNGLQLEMPSEYNLTIDSSYNHKTTYTYKSKLGEVTYQLNISEYYNNMYHSDSLRNIEFDLDYSQKSTKVFQESDLYSTRHKSIKGYPGKEYRLRHLYNSTINLRRVYIIKNNLVELIYSGPESKLYDKEIMIFLNSLQLNGIQKNSKPYLDIPTQDQLKIRPYESEIDSNSEQRVEILPLKDEKNVVIITFEEFNPLMNDGLRAIGVMYSDFSEAPTDQEKDDYFNNYIQEQSIRYNKFTLIEEKSHNTWKSYKFKYQIGEEVMFEERRIKFEGKRIYQITGIHSNSERTPKKIISFFKTFKIK